MTGLPIGLVPHQYPTPQLNNDGFLDDETVPMKTGNVPTRVGKRDLVDIFRFEPDLVLSAF